MVSLCSILVFSASVTKKKADRDTEQFRYEIDYEKTAGEGIVSVKVSSMSKKPNIAEEQCKKNAVHGVIFKGYYGTGSVHPALAKDPAAETDNADFFKSFFSDGGQYMRYVTSVQSGSTSISKVGKEYKVSVIVNVNKNALRKALEKAGVIKSLSAGL